MDERKIVRLRETLIDGSRPGAAAAGAVTITGDGVVVGDGNRVVVIKTEKVIRRVRAVPVPGDEHITEAQVAKLHELVRQIVEMEQLVKRSPASKDRVWGALNRRMCVGAMRMIPVEKFPAAEKYLREWLGRLNSTKTAVKRDPEHQKKRIIAIQTVMKRHGLEERVRGYMRKTFCCGSLKELDHEALERVYRYSMRIKGVDGQ
ncbi:MAG: hypothetical protein HQL40_13295 [Alphaproteobacteria bacterium]|nr:hypothetical protein [Alphaproteobacteria bacterium]